MVHGLPPHTIMHVGESTHTHTRTCTRAKREISFRLLENSFEDGANLTSRESVTRSMSSTVLNVLKNCVCTGCEFEYSIPYDVFLRW